MGSDTSVEEQRRSEVCSGPALGTRNLTRTIVLHSSSSSLVDLQVWKLLDDILEASANPTRGSHISSSRPLRTWLLPLLNRIPTAPILITFLNSVAQGASSALLFHATRTLVSIWPLAVPKISVDTLLDCYAAVTGLFMRQFWKTCDTPTASLLIRLANLVVSSYRSSLAHSSAKKKVSPVAPIVLRRSFHENQPAVYSVLSTCIR